jgi:hypothetical protein
VARSFLNTVLYTRDQEGYEGKLLFLFIYTLFCNSSTFSQFSATSSFAGIFVLILIPLVLIFTGIYYYSAFFIYKRFTVIDLFVIAWAFVPIYNALATHFTLDVKILKAIFPNMAKYIIFSASLLYYLIRYEKITVKQYCLAGVLVGWFNLVMYVLINIYMDPQGFKEDEGLVGYNEAKGGYIWRLSSVYIVFAITYHFVVFIVRNSFFHLISFLLFTAYLFFFDKQRTEILSVLIPLFFYLFIRMRWYETINRLFQIIILVAIIAGVIYYINPMLLQFTADMFINFFKFMLGMETGEASADSRIVQFTNAYNYFERHPNQIFFGIGYPKAELLFLEMGKFIFVDCGIVGILVAHGIIGTIFQLSMFLFPIYVLYKVKHYRTDIFFNMGILGCAITFARGMFSGDFASNAFGLFYFFSFVEYYRVKEKIYWKNKKLEMKENSNESI